MHSWQIFLKKIFSSKDNIGLFGVLVGVIKCANNTVKYVLLVNFLVAGFRPTKVLKPHRATPTRWRLGTSKSLVDITTSVGRAARAKWDKIMRRC